MIYFTTVREGCLGEILYKFSHSRPRSEGLQFKTEMVTTRHTETRSINGERQSRRNRYFTPIIVTDGVTQQNYHHSIVCIS